VFFFLPFIHPFIYLFILDRSHEGLPSHSALATPTMIPLEDLSLFVEIASGNFGKVYKAVYQGCLVVIKVPKEANLKVFSCVFFFCTAIVHHYALSFF
jgi:hypothetical protein